VYCPSYKWHTSDLVPFVLLQIENQLEVFKKNLEAFAVKYKDQLKKDPEFRQYFNELCAKIGVDPLVSSKGFWGQLLGVGDFYYELGVQIVEICIQTRPMNGGLMDMDDALVALKKKRGANGKALNKDDIDRAVSQLHVLGSGFQIIKLGKRKLLQSVPYQLSNDHTAILELAQGANYVTLEGIMAELHWNEARAKLILSELLEEGMAWVDIDPTSRQHLYWFPTLYFGSSSGSSVASSSSSSSSPSTVKQSSSS